MSSNPGSFVNVRTKKIILAGVLSDLRLSRTASLNNLLMRFLVTAFPIFLDNKMAYWNESDNSQTKLKYFPGRRSPFFKSRSISMRLLRVSVRGSLFVMANFGSQVFSFLAAAARQYPAAAFGRHSFPEAVVVFAFSIGRLISSFHFIFLSLRWGNIKIVPVPSRQIRLFGTIP